MASSLTSLVSNYLYTQRIRQDSLSVEKLATAVAPLFQTSAADSLTEELVSSAAEMGGRLLIVDRNGKVQADTFQELNGIRLQVPEVLSVLMDNQSSSYGIHILQEEAGDLPGVGSAIAQVAYCAALLTGIRGALGALLFVSSVDEMVSGMTQVQQRMLTLFLIVAVAALVAALFIARALTRPVTGLTQAIQKMGKGDLSVRAPVSGSGELRELAVNYNTMAAQLETLDKSRNQFVSNASHELKTPLTSLKVMLETLIYQPEMPTELRTEFMQDMDHEIDRLSGIITDLLTLSRLDSNQKSALQIRACDLSELTESIARRLTPIAEQRKQSLQLNVGHGLSAQVDADRIEQVFYNLIDNALKYTPEGGKIQVRLRREGKSLIWQVEDTGIGIPEEDIPHIFDRFYRVDKARSRETGGTGLGLSIAQQLVQLHGGEISVESRQGKGSIFTVRLPMKSGGEASA